MCIYFKKKVTKVTKVLKASIHASFVGNLLRLLKVTKVTKKVTTGICSRYSYLILQVVTSCYELLRRFVTPQT